MKRFGKLIAVLMLAMVLAMSWAWYSMRAYLDAPMANTAPYALEIAGGSTLQQVLERLAADGVSDDVHWLLLHARRDGSDQRIKAGDYTVPPGMTPRELLQLLIDGAVNLERLTLVEGWTVAEALAALLAHPAVEDDLGVNLVTRADGTPWLAAAEQRALAARLGVAGDSAEGWLAPETYRFARGTPASTLVVQAHQQMRSWLADAWAQAGPDPYLDDPYQVLILASIIEKETSRDDERAAIAGVFARRLQRGMRLQTDPTVIYGIGIDYDGNIRRRDLTARTRYNTYQIDGLPPTPIALPGRESLLAAVTPADGDALFFVATGSGDGSHYFSATHEEHQRAVQRYLQRLRQNREPGGR